MYNNYTYVYYYSSFDWIMGWKTIKGRRYFYEWAEDGEVSRGSGAEAKLAASRVDRVKNKAVVERAFVSRWRIEDSKVDQFSADVSRAVDALIGEALWSFGYRHTKGRWRKMNSKSKKAGESGAVNGSSLGYEALINLDNDVRRLALEGLQRSGLGAELEEAEIERLRLEVAAKVEAMRVEFRYEDCSAIEKLLVEQLATAWVQWYVASWQLESLSIEDGNLKRSQYLEKRYFRCQTRLSRLVDQLARVRCLPRVYLKNCKN